MKELLAEKERLVAEYRRAYERGYHDKLVYEKIMDINKKITMFNRWGLNNG